MQARKLALSRLSLALVMSFSVSVCAANLARPAAAETTKPEGEWSPVYAWPDVAVHLHLLPDGRVLSFSDDDHDEFHTRGTRLAGFSKAFVIDIPPGQPPSREPIYVPNITTNLFCSGHVSLPDGRLLAAGGHVDRNHYGSADVNLLELGDRYAWRKVASMRGGRWYPSALKLANGEVLVLGGSRSGADDPNKLPEVWRTNAGGGWRGLTSAVLAVPYYPYLHLAPNGKVLMTGPARETKFLDAAGQGAWTAGPTRKFGNRRYGTSVLYDRGRILMLGGGNPPTASAETIDLNTSSPAWKATGAMIHPRRHVNATLLPDGKVLVTGGTSASNNDERGAVLAAEMWDPATGQWSAMASMRTPRLYHSTALLLPDGRVLSAGGGRGAGGTAYENAEIYSPPYLFAGPRPTITAAPTAIRYGAGFFVETPDAASVRRVTLVSLASVTHTVNMSQQVDRPAFSPTGGGLDVKAPANRRLMPPGHYMLFLVTADGVPSVARIVHLS